MRHQILHAGRSWHSADLLHWAGAVDNLLLQVVEMTGVPVDVWLMDVVIKGHIISIEQGDQAKGVAWIRLGCCGIEDRDGPLPRTYPISPTYLALHR